MKVTTVSASVRFSKAIGEGQHKTVELSAEAALDGQETWTEAQANLYQELGHQIKTLWGSSNGLKAAETPMEPELPQKPLHYCEEHQTEYKRYEKDSRIWYSHKKADGNWCKEK
jgi:hypothetical protein